MVGAFYIMPRFIPEYKKYNIKPVAWEDKFNPITEEQKEKLNHVQNQIEFINTEAAQLPNINNKTAEDWKSQFNNTTFVALDEKAAMPDYLNIADDEQEKPSPPNQGQDISLENNDYLLLVDGALLTSGTKDEIELQVSQLIYGDHSKFESKVDPDNILVYKKINIKIGIFLDG
jgi:hypothetical protein